MFGIELDLVKKIEIGFCAVVLAVAGYLIFTNTRKPVDETVAAKLETINIGKDGTQRITTLNPEDPLRSYTLTSFTNSDGILRFKEYPKRKQLDPADTSRAEITFIHAAKDQKDPYNCFLPMMRIVQDYKDPPRRAVAMATICSLYHTQFANQYPRLFSRLSMTPADFQVANTEFTNLQNKLALIDSDVSAGIVETNQYNQVMAAFEKFRSYGSVDLRANPTQGTDAKKVMEVGLPYAKIVQDRRLKLIDEYVDTMVAKLNATQKQTAVDIGQKVLETYLTWQRTNAGRRTVAR